MMQGCIDIQRRGEVWTCDRARVQAMGDGVQLARQVPSQVGAFGQILAQQPSGDVIGAALPGAVRIANNTWTASRSTRVPTAEHLRAPLRRSPSR